MYDCKPRSTSSQQGLKWNGEDFVDPKKYRELVGSLIYPMTCTRPGDDTVFVGNLSKSIGLRLSMYCAT